MLDTDTSLVYRFGINGTEGRCYKLFLNYSVCMDQSEKPVEECRLYKEDYLECLHHTKEFERRKKIIARWNELGRKLPETPESGEARPEQAHGSNHH